MDLRTTGIATRKVALCHLHFTSLKDLFKRAPALCFLCVLPGLLEHSFAHKPKPLYFGLTEYSTGKCLFSFSALHPVK